MMNPVSLTCETIAEGQVLERYVNGLLDPEKAEQFEAHYFGCDRCWEELQAALEVRAAISPGERTPLARAAFEKVSKPSWIRALWRWGAPLAAAAVLVLVLGILTIGDRLPQSDVPAVTRGAAASLSVTIMRAGDSIRMTWPEVEGAVRHRVSAFTGDGLLLFTDESAATPFVTGSGFADTLAQVFVQVEALDRVGAVLATSPLEQVPR